MLLLTCPVRRHEDKKNASEQQPNLSVRVIETHFFN